MLACLLLAAGCSTPKSVAKMEGAGMRRVFDAQFDPVWTAAIAAAEMDDLRVLDSNKATGYISARRAMSPATFGENVGIWVRALTPVRTEVEIVSRQSGPPLFILGPSDRPLLKRIAIMVEE